MVKFELDVDLNELSDEELEAYLTLKKRLKEKGFKGMESIEPPEVEKIPESNIFKRVKEQKERERLSAEKLIQSEKLAEAELHEKQFELDALEIQKQEEQRFEEQQTKEIVRLRKERDEAVNLLAETTKPIVETGRFWTDEMTRCLYKLKITGTSNDKIAKELNEKFGTKISAPQIENKIGNMKHREQWGTQLLSPHEISISEVKPEDVPPIVDDEELEPEIKYRTIVKVPKRRRLPQVPLKEREEWFKNARELMENGKESSFRQAFIKVAKGREAGGPIYTEYKLYCKKKNIDPMIKGHKFKSDKRREPGYMLDRNAFLRWRAKKLEVVMKYHNLSPTEATSYLASQWRKSKRNPFLADNLVREGIYKKGRVRIKPDMCLPDLPFINALTQTILTNMIENILGNPALTLSFDMEGQMLGIEHYQNWVIFAKEFVSKRDVIADCFGVRGRFILISSKKRMGLSIKYQGKSILK